MNSAKTIDLRLHSTGSGLPLILMHALPVTRNLFEGFQPPPGYRLILTDYPGFGGSELPADDLTFTNLAHALHQALQKGGMTGPIALGGVSMGGYWAMEYLRLYPDNIDRMVFIATRANAEAEEARKKRLEVAERLKTMKMGEMPLPELLGATTRLSKPEVVERFRREVAGVDPKAVAYANRMIASRLDQIGTIKNLAVPALWMYGGEDPAVKTEEARAFGALNPQVHLVEVAHCGHLIPWEDPEGFQTNLNQFLNT